MTCLSPLKGFRIGRTLNGKNKLKVVPWNTVQVFYDPVHDRSMPVFDDSPPPKRADGNGSWLVTKDFIEIPCGQCLGCRQQRSREWANRLMCEAKYHEDNWFITFTYDDDNVPLREYTDDDGVLQISLSLQAKDLQDFWKRLRKAIEPEKVRYFAAGEYGDKTYRPHYHAIVFGLKIPDLVLYRQNENYVYYNSEWLQSIWNKGNVIIAKVNWASCAYVAAYCTKKLTGDLAKKVYGKLNIDPPFNVMSRRPGIGREFYDDVVSNMEQDSKFINVSTPDGGVKFTRPRYYKKLDMATLDPEDSDDWLDYSPVLQDFFRNHEDFVDLVDTNDNNRAIIERETPYILSLRAKELELRKQHENKRKEL